MIALELTVPDDTDLSALISLKPSACTSDIVPTSELKPFCIVPASILTAEPSLFSSFI